MLILLMNHLLIVLIVFKLLIGATAPESNRIALLLINEDRKVIILHERQDAIWKLTFRNLTEFIV